MRTMMTIKAGLWRRWASGHRWSWMNERFRANLPTDFDESAMDRQVSDRFHAKQGRSTARLRLDAPNGQGRVSGYLKRHSQLPWRTRLAAWLDPEGRHSPAAVEWVRLEQARALGIDVPQVIAVGERSGPRASLQCYLYVAELEGREELHLAIPKLARSPNFAARKRELVRELAELAAKLHNAFWFHKDLYLCHLFLDWDRLEASGDRLSLIDLQRLQRHPIAAARWRAKDLGQLLYSTFGVEGIDDRDRLRFWMHYRRLTTLRAPRLQAAWARSKAMRYWRHNSS